MMKIEGKLFSSRQTEPSKFQTYATIEISPEKAAEQLNFNEACHLHLALTTKINSMQDKPTQAKFKPIIPTTAGLSNSTQEWCECEKPNMKFPNCGEKVCFTCGKPLKPTPEPIEELELKHSTGYTRPNYPLPFTIEDVVTGINRIIRQINTLSKLVREK